MNQLTLVKTRYRLEQWIQMVRDCQSSGLKVDDWCAANGVTRDAYYYWLRKVHKAACQSLQSETHTTFKNLEVKAMTASVQAAVVIHLPSVTLEVQNGVSEQTLEAVLHALKTVC